MLIKLAMELQRLLYLAEDVTGFHSEWGTNIRRYQPFQRGDRLYSSESDVYNNIIISNGRRPIP